MAESSIVYLQKWNKSLRLLASMICFQNYMDPSSYSRCEFSIIDVPLGKKASQHKRYLQISAFFGASLPCLRIHIDCEDCLRCLECHTCLNVLWPLCIGLCFRKAKLH